MNRIYAFFIASIIVVMLLLALSFIFFEKEKHENIFYTICQNGENIGYIKADRYRTEDKIIYKSMAYHAKALSGRMRHEKIFFSKKEFHLKKFIREYKDFHSITQALYLTVKGEVFDFLSKVGSKWSRAIDIPHMKDAIVFDEFSIITYMPFVDKYDFTKGGAQSFNVLYLSSPLLPPARTKIVFKSVRDEFIKVNGKKTKTELLLVRGKALPQIHIWVLKKNKKIVRLEIEKSLLIHQVTFLPKINVTAYRPSSSDYNAEEVLFPSGDIALSGTLTIPKQQRGKLAAVLLVPGEKLYARENGGIYTDISNCLTKNGYITLRYDKRGTGKSQGDISSVSLANEIKDIQNALKFLSEHARVDERELFILAYGETGSYIPQLDFSSLRVRGLVLLSLKKPDVLLDFGCNYVTSQIKKMEKLDKEYPKIVALSTQQTLNSIRNTKKDYIFAQGKRLFAKRMKRLVNFDPFNGFMKLDIPTLVIYGKKDRYGSLEYINKIEELRVKNKSLDLQVVYFSRLGYFLGSLVNSPHLATYYKIDKEALETIVDWLDSKRSSGG